MRALGLMPFLFFCGVAIYLRERKTWREAAIASGIVTGVWVVAGCELLSVFKAVASWPLLIWWAVPIGFLAWKCRNWRPMRPVFTNDWVLLAIVSATVLALGLIFVQAALTPPNNWDALSYHLPRQVFWMQQRHVGLFPANDVRMLVMQPFAEYAGLHLMILSGGDRWANLIQWFALALTALTASAIARELGCNVRLQAVAALMVVSIPIAALEAANPKNDVVAAFFLCVFALAGLKAYNSRTFSAPMIGAAGGLLVLSKGTGMIFGLPVALWIGAACMRVLGLKRALPCAAAAALIALLINAGFVGRITAAFGSPMGPHAEESGAALANRLLTARALLSNLVRNTAMHLATGAERIDSATTRVVTAFHEWLGLDVNDPRTTFGKSGPFVVTANFTDEDRGKAPIHMVLGLTALAIGVTSLFRVGDKFSAMFLLIPFICFALFSYLIAWQEWHSRLHIPALCLAAPVIVRVLSRIALPSGVLAFALGLMCIVNNDAKPITRLKQARHRFKDPPMLAGIAEAKRAIGERHADVVGIAARVNRCEYFLLSSLLKARKHPPQFVTVNNRFPQIQPRYTNVDLVISWDRPVAVSNETFITRYQMITDSGVVAVFVPR